MRALRAWRVGHRVSLTCSVECLGLPRRIAVVVREAAGAAPLGATVGAVVLLVDQGLVGALGLSARDAARLVSAVEGLGLDVEALHLRGHTVTEACPVACLRLSEGARRMVTEAGVRHADLWEYETRRPTLHQVGTAGEVRDLLWTGFVAGRPVEMAELFAAVGAMQTGRGSRAGNERKGRQ